MLHSAFMTIIAKKAKTCTHSICLNVMVTEVCAPWLLLPSVPQMGMHRCHL